MLVDNAITTVQRLKDYLGIDSTTATEDDVLERIVNSVTAFVENYTGRRIMQTAHTAEYHDGHRDERIILDNWPVSTTATFTLQYRDSGSNEDDWETVDGEDYYIKYENGMIHKIAQSNWMKAIRKYRVAYTAGFDFDNATKFLSDTAAGDLEFVAWKLGSIAWNKRKSDPGVKSERLGDYAVSFMAGAMEDGDVRSILDRYRRFEVVSVMTPKHT